MLVQAGAKAVNEGDCTDVQGGLVRMRCAWAVGLQGLLDDAQKMRNTMPSYHAVALHKVAQPLGNRQHPLAHWQAGRRGR